MVNWIKWKLIWCVICVVVTYTRIVQWLKTKGLYTLVYCLRIFTMVEFVLCCIKLDYNSDQRTFLYAYIVLMAASFYMLGKFLNSIKENENGNSTS